MKRFQAARLIREAHATLMHGVRGQHRMPGVAFSALNVFVSAMCMCVIATLASGASSLPAEEGLASVYSTQFNSKITASGERYDGNVHTGAHRTLPFGTVVKVTNLDNGKSVRVRINDRGPHVRGRIIDLSSSAAAALGMTTGVARARIEVLSGTGHAGAKGPSRP